MRPGKRFPTVVALFRGFLIFGLSCLALSGLVQAGAAAVQPRAVTRIDENVRRTLRGNTHPLARREFDLGPVSADLPMDRMLLVLSRSPQQEAVLQELLRKQHDEGSTEYHHWLTPDQFGQSFGAAETDLQTVTTWLESHGMKVAHVSRGRRIIEFSGTAGEVQDAFRTEIHRYFANGAEHLANATDPQIPAALASVVTGIATLHNFKTHPQSMMTPATFRQQASGPQFNSGSGEHALSPADYAVIYNINPLYQAGITGKGATIGVVARSNIKLQDVIDFRHNFGLSGNAPQIVLNGPDPGDLGGGEEAEAVLDASWSGATAPGSTVKLVVSGSTNATDGVFLSELYIIDNNLADVMTASFGSCEAHFTQGQAAVISALAEQAAAQGITYAVAAGDSGSAGCDDPNTETQATGPLSVNILASTPYTIAVGGSSFAEWETAPFWNSKNSPTGSSAISYIPEVTWDETCMQDQCPALWAGGGGVSRIFSKPAWQSGVAGIPNDEARDVPDIALTSAGHDPYLICLAGSCEATSRGQIHFAGIAGTSAAAPAFAGVMALVKQKTGARQGQANYKIYRLAATENFSACNASGSGPAANCIFNDITTGSNAVPGTFSSFNYRAGTGYDLATGLGSLNVANFVNHWGGAANGSDIRINIDRPGSQAPTFSGAVQFGGWAFSDTSTINRVLYAIDGIPYGAATYGSGRPDVCAIFRNRAGCPNVGWDFLFDTSLLADGSHSLDITALTVDGKSETSSTNFGVDNVTPPMRICIDLPNKQSGALSGPAFFAGWAIDDFAAIGSVAISIDGAPQGTAVYGASRPDVCAVYSGRQGCPNVGWAFSFDTGLLEDGSHTLEVRGVSEGGRQATVTTTFKTSNAAASPIQIAVDRPNAQSAALNGIASLGGWAFSGDGAIGSVAISVDGVAFGNAAYGGNRADVCRVHSGKAGCPNVGWNALLDTTLLSDGSHMLQVTVTSVAGQHSTVAMPFRVANLSGNSMTISIDTPNAKGPGAIGGIIAGGWAIDNDGAVTQIAVSVDGVGLGNATYGLNRPDVCTRFPGRAGCPNVGWNIPIDTTLLSNGTHTIEVTALSSTGRHTTTSSSFQVANWLANPTRISIDQPNSGAIPFSGIAGFAGWAIDDYSAITSVTISIDGIPYGNAIYGISRPDVCAIYSGRLGCPNVGWNFAMDTTRLADGVHLLQVTALSSEGWRSTATAAFTVANVARNGIQVSIDQPSSSGVPVSGLTTFAGWAFGNMLATNVIISIDGVSYGNAIYGLSRPDVCLVYPYAPFCPNVGWSFTFDATRLSNGLHKLGVTLSSFAVAGGTVTSWFTVANPSIN
ncbi:MAG TPA: S53 family peptidase [Bryobacteraceae bacterium]|jgi:hypothetical protein